MISLFNTPNGTTAEIKEFFIKNNGNTFDVCFRSIFGVEYILKPDQTYQEARNRLKNLKTSFPKGLKAIKKEVGWRQVP